MRNDAGETPLDRLRSDTPAANREALGDLSREAPRARVDAPRATTVEAPTVNAAHAETVFWQSIEGSRNATEFEIYLEQFPDGQYVQPARSRLAARSALPSIGLVAERLGGGLAATEAELPSVESDPPSSEAISTTANADPISRDPGTVFRDCDYCPRMVVMPAGGFRMGSTDGQADERPVHDVQVGAFALGGFEVTVEEYAAFVTHADYALEGCAVIGGDGRSEWTEGRSWRDPGFAQGEGHPVVCVGWDDAKAYANWLSIRTGARYHLPSEAMWEYAARAGTRGRRYWNAASGTQCDHANGGDRTLMRRLRGWPLPVVTCTDNVAHTAPVGSYKANAFGLYDMLGNVWEWTADCWHDDYTRAPSDGSAWTRGGDCDRPVLRGGSWETALSGVRSANRYWSDIRASNATGFRVARRVD